MIKAGMRKSTDSRRVITPFQNTFIELPLSEGTHEIKLVFRPRGLTLGLVTPLAAS